VESGLGHYLGRYINSPLRRFLSQGPATVHTFLGSGAIHDLLFSLVVRSTTFLFVPGSCCSGLVRCHCASPPRLPTHRWPVRAAVNLGLVLAGLGLAMLESECWEFHEGVRLS
jgi:hypothetical protein